MPRPATIPLHKVVFHCHDLHSEHVHVTDPSLPLSKGPIEVEALLQGEFYVHNGRHRVLRARERGEAWIDAIIMNEADPDADVPTMHDRALYTIYNAWSHGIDFTTAVRQAALYVNGSHDHPRSVAELLVEQPEQQDDFDTLVGGGEPKRGRHRGE